MLDSVSAEKQYFGDDRRNDREEEESISLRLYNYKPAKKSKLKICDIGKCIKAISSTSILVEGVPGMGKTAFAWELCHKWAIGELLQDWSIVIFIDLCNEQVREAKLLSDFLYHPDQAMREKICQDLVTSEGKKVLFIVDGHDQLNEQQMPTHRSVYQQLTDKDLLPGATIMILSKASCRRQHEHSDRHIQVSCFTNQCINNYITSACSSDNDELLTAFKSYLSSNTYIHTLMHIPAQCVMITDLYRLHWNHGDTEYSPSTLTELYTDLVTTLLLRYLSTHREYSQINWVLKEFTDLPEKANKSFMALAELAAQGIKESMYVFDKPTDFDTLGLMQKVDEVYPGRENSESYSFLNLTLQEYLAAYYCSQQDSLERLKIVLRLECPLEHFLDSYCHKCVYEYCRECEYRQDCHHKAVFLFMAGLAKLQSCNVEALLENGPTRSLSAMHLLYETQTPDLIRLATFSAHLPAKQSTQGLMDVPKPHIPLDLFVIGYCIPHSNRSWQLNTTTFASDKHFLFQLGEEYMKALPLEERKKALLCVLYFKALSKGLDMSSEQSCNAGHIMKLIVFENNIPWLHLLHPHTQRVTELFIQSVPQQEEVGEREYRKFHLFYPLLKNLLVNGVLTKGFLPLLQVIPSFITLEKLYLWFEVNSCLSKNMDDISAISKQLQTCPVTHEITAYTFSDFPSYFLTISPNLAVLQLFHLTLTPQLTKCETSSLKILKIKSCKIPEDACTGLMHFLQSPLCVLEGFLLYSLEFHYRHSSSIPFELVEAIASNCNLKWCAIKGVDDSFVQHLVTGLKKSKGQSRLEELTVLCEYHEKKNCEHCNELIRVVNEHDSIKVLQLSHQFEYYMRNHDTIRESLTIPEYDRSSKCLSRWQNM